MAGTLLTSPPLARSEEPPAISPELQALILGLREAGAPSADHGALEPLAGSWDVEATWFLPDGQEVRSTGTSQQRWILGGRFLLCEAAVGEADSRVEALSLYGFDRGRRQYFVVAASDASTALFEAWGGYDAARRSLLLAGKSRDPSSGLAAVYRELLTVEGPDRHRLELFFDAVGSTPVRVLEVRFQRSGTGADAG